MSAAPLHRYRAFGLRIASAIELPELPIRPEGDGAADVAIQRGAVPPLPPGDGAARFEGNEARFAWDAVGRFRVRPGGVEVDAPDASDDLVAFPLLGPVLAALLHLRGTLVLHASAVATPAGAVVLMGHKGAGKSTTAAALVAAGGALIADDIVALAPEATTPRVWGGAGQLKLDPAAVAIAPDGVRRADAHVAIPKVRLRLPADPPRATSLAALLVVEREGAGDAGAGDAGGRDLRVEPSPAPLADVLAFSYAARFGADALSGPARARHLRLCAALVDRPGVGRLRVPDGLDALARAATGWMASSSSGAAA